MHTRTDARPCNTRTWTCTLAHTRVPAPLHTCAGGGGSVRVQLAPHPSSAPQQPELELQHAGPQPPRFKDGVPQPLQQPPLSPAWLDRALHACVRSPSTQSPQLHHATQAHGNQPSPLLLPGPPTPSPTIPPPPTPPEPPPPAPHPQPSPGNAEPARQLSRTETGTEGAGGARAGGAAPARAAAATQAEGAEDSEEGPSGAGSALQEEHAPLQPVGKGYGDATHVYESPAQVQAQQQGGQRQAQQPLAAQQLEQAQQQLLHRLPQLSALSKRVSYQRSSMPRVDSVGAVFELERACQQVRTRACEATRSRACACFWCVRHMHARPWVRALGCARAQGFPAST